MSAEIIYGNQLAEELRQEMKEEVRTLNESRIHPKLVVVIIGEDPASMSYVKGKQRASEKVGLDSDLIELPEETTEEELLSLIDRLNHDETVHGILVQLPVPDHISDQKIIEAIAPEKDVDGFHPSNVGKMMTGQDTFSHAPLMELLSCLNEQTLIWKGSTSLSSGEVTSSASRWDSSFLIKTRP